MQPYSCYTDYTGLIGEGDSVTEAKNSNRVSEVNPFEKPGQPPAEIPSQPPPAMSLATQQMTLMYQQITAAQERVTALEQQLRDSEKGRRDDNERLLRELMDAKIANAQLAEQLKQKESRE